MSDMRIRRGLILLRVGQRDGQEFSYIYILNIYEYIEAANALTLRDWHDIVATSKKEDEYKEEDAG